MSVRSVPSRGSVGSRRALRCVVEYIDSLDRLCEHGLSLNSVPSSSSCGTTPTFLSLISYHFAPTGRGYTATSAARSITQPLSITLYSRERKWHRYNKRQLKGEPLLLESRQRKSVEAAIRETCKIRGWSLLAFDVRTSHVHTVVTAHRKSALVLTAFKANATRRLREDGLWPHAFSPWARKGSKRRLWNEQSVARAIEYVLYGQGCELPDFDD